jgi:hypothetical protein
MARKAKKKGIKYWKGEAWDEFSKFIRLRDALRTTGTKDYLVCCSCGKQYPAFGVRCAQAGHFIAGRKNAILFDEKCCHGQCYNCNHTLKGNWPGYMEFMLNRYGRPTVDKLLRQNKSVVKFTVSDLMDKRSLYKSRYDALLKGETQ